MTFKMLLFAFLVLLIAEVTSGKFDCESDPFSTRCGRPSVHNNIPREISLFNEQCEEMKSHLRCAKDYQDECGTGRLTLFPSDNLFEATFGTVSNVCEEGTLLNTVATENLKCFNETFGKTRCLADSYEFIDTIIEKANDDEELQNNLSFHCLGEAYRYECALRALSENCGELVEEATREFLRRSKSLEYACTVGRAQAVLDNLDKFDLSEEKKRYMTELLEKLVEENSN